MSSLEVQHLLGPVWADLQDADVWWQIAAIVCAVVLGWVFASRVRLAAQQRAAERLTAERFASLLDTVGPLAAFVLLYALRPWLARWHHVNLLNLAIPLLGAMVLVRTSVFLLRRAFPRATLLAGFERWITLSIWFVFALHILGVLPEIIGFLDSLTIPVGKQSATLWTVLQATFWVVVTCLLTLWLGGIIEGRLMRAETLHSSLRVVLSRVVRALLVVFGVLITLPLLGIDLTLLSVFGGALGVGLGFGLQKIASNYMSGFIILLERSVRIGDLVTIDQFFGEVRGITTRYVVVRAQDGREAIIPNETLIAQTVINHSLTDRLVRVATTIQISYRSDLERALLLLTEIAGRHPRVLADPPPHAHVVAFADSGINVEAGFWIRDPQNGIGNVRSDVSVEILREFRSAGIEIPYPQREIRLIPDNIRADTAKEFASSG